MGISTEKIESLKKIIDENRWTYQSIPDIKTNDAFEALYQIIDKMVDCLEG